MEQWEFHELALETVERFRPRINPKWIGAIDSELAGGEFALAVEDLLDIVTGDQIPVSPQERDTLNILARYLKEDGFLVKLDAVNVISGAENDAE